jgi:hypothetical protein
VVIHVLRERAFIGVSNSCILCVSMPLFHQQDLAPCCVISNLVLSKP